MRILLAGGSINTCFTEATFEKLSFIDEIKFKRRDLNSPGENKAPVTCVRQRKWSHRGRWEMGGEETWWLLMLLCCLLTQPVKPSSLQLFWEPLQADLEAQTRGPEHRQHLHSTERFLSGLQHSACSLSPLRSPGPLPFRGSRSSVSARCARVRQVGLGGRLRAGGAAQVVWRRADDGCPRPSASEGGGATAPSDSENGKWLREQ